MPPPIDEGHRAERAGRSIGVDGLAAGIPLPRAEWSADDLVHAARDHGLQVVSLLHVGGDGWLKTLDFVPRSEAHLRRILLGGERADGSSLFDGTGIDAGSSDVVLRPRPGTAFLDPFAATPTLAVLCGHAGPDGSPLPQSPDTIVHHADEHLVAETGTRLRAFGEVEFFLGRPADGTDVYGTDERGYHATAPFVFGQGLRRRAMILLSGMGIPVKYGHSEVGYFGAPDDGGLLWEQHEIELDLLPLPDAADAIVLTHWALRNLAHNAGLRCSIEPMIAQRHAGNGMHVHLAAMAGDEAAGVRRPDGHLTESARWLIGGLVEMGGALMAFGNRHPCSFTRLLEGKEAPQRICWGDHDRRALIRLPTVPTAADGSPIAAPTVEFRLPDGSAHPHLLLAGIAQAMVRGRHLQDLDSLLEATASGAAGDGRPPAPIPRDFAAVADAVEQHREALLAGDVLMPPMLDLMIERLREGRPGVS